MYCIEPIIDRAWIEVHWTRGHLGTACELVLDLTGGALLLEGESHVPVDPEAASGSHRWLVEFPIATELHALVRYCGGTVEETDVNHRPRVAGQAKYGIGNRALRGLKDCLAVRWMRSRVIVYRVGSEQ